MSRSFEGGGGNEFQWSSYTIIDTGAGDDAVLNGMYLGAGGGDPLLFGVDAPLEIQGTLDLYIPIWSRYFSPSRVEDQYVFSQEGGWLIAVYSPGLIWPDGEYRVDLLDSITGQPYPKLKPGCNGAIFGRGQKCRPVVGNRQLRFALPAAPVGDYRIKVTMPDNVVLTSARTIHLTHTPESRIFRSMSRFPFNVMRVKSPIQDL